MKTPFTDALELEKIKDEYRAKFKASKPKVEDSRFYVANVLHNVEKGLDGNVIHVDFKNKKWGGKWKRK